MKHAPELHLNVRPSHAVTSMSCVTKLLTKAQVMRDLDRAQAMVG